MVSPVAPSGPGSQAADEAVAVSPPSGPGLRPPIVRGVYQLSNARNQNTVRESNPASLSHLTLRPRKRGRFLFAYAFPSAASSRNKILAINVLLGVPTVTNPSDVVYKPMAMWPLSSAVILFPENQLPHALRLTEVAPCVHPAEARPCHHRK